MMQVDRNLRSKGMEKLLVKKKLLFVLLFALAAACCSEARAQVIVIANPGIKAAEVSKDDLRDIFTGASSTLHGGSQIVPVLLKRGTANDEFLSRYIGRSDAAFRASWRSIVFSGQGVMPRTLDPEAAVVEYVAHTAGAIGYIERTVPHEGVKTLAVR
jgi:ABC-type phosphate transport system substrate-binding protein